MISGHVLRHEVAHYFQGKILGVQSEIFLPPVGGLCRIDPSTEVSPENLCRIKLAGVAYEHHVRGGTGALNSFLWMDDLQDAHLLAQEHGLDLDNLWWLAKNFIEVSLHAIDVIADTTILPEEEIPGTPTHY